MPQKFQGLILSHQNASVDIREQVAFSDAEATQFIQFFKEEADCTDLFIISTCNRTEIYFTCENDILDKICRMIKVIKNIDDDILKYFQLKEEDDAVHHLFRVSAGLESSILGDLQITNQVKVAYQKSADLQVAGPFLHRLLHTIFYAHKRIIQETNFKLGIASLSYAATDLAKRKAKEFVDPSILLIGAGEIGKDVIKNLAPLADDLKIAVSNRTESKVSSILNDLTSGNKLEVIPFNELKKHITKFDIVISSISCAQPIITKENFIQDESLRHKYMLDLGIPRNVAPNIEEIPGVISYNVDEIQMKINDDSQKRMDAIPHVEQILNESVQSFSEWSNELLVSPTIKQLKNSLEEIRQKEMTKYLQKADDQTLSMMDELTQNMMKKVLNVHVLQLKDACKRGDADSLIDVLNDLFNLEKKTV